MRILKLFQRDILTLRSHQWKYYLEPYVGCGLHCLYCIYGGSNEFYSRVRPTPDLLQLLIQDLEDLPARQIVYIGASVDPYQPLERDARQTRRVLELLLEYCVPTMILTKSPLILNDLDLLKALNAQGLLLVQFTVLTLDQRKSEILEKRTASPQQRLAAARALADIGIPVHFHVSPYIPHFYAQEELTSLVKAIGLSGGTCIYTNTLGMRHSNQDILLRAFESLDKEMADTVRKLYPEEARDGHGVYSPYTKHVVEDMLNLRDICRRYGMNFVCEFIPQFTSVDFAEFKEGIFRFGLPAVYQMLGYWDQASGEAIGWERFERDFLMTFPAVDLEYLELVKSLWNERELFENTILIPVTADGEVKYLAGEDLRVDGNKVLYWD